MAGKVTIVVFLFTTLLVLSALIQEVECYYVKGTGSLDTLVKKTEESTILETEESSVKPSEGSTEESTIKESEESQVKARQESSAQALNEEASSHKVDPLKEGIPGSFVGR